MNELRTYSGLMQYDNFLSRFLYLKLEGEVGEETFGSNRYVDQQFYRSAAWRNIRHHIIARDLGCDLGIDGRAIHHKILVHHINPITLDDILNNSPKLLDPENLITTSHRTHNAIHFGDEALLVQDHIPRRANDTRLW